MAEDEAWRLLGLAGRVALWGVVVGLILWRTAGRLK